MKIGAEILFTSHGTLRLTALTDITFCQFDPSRWRELLDRPTLVERLLRIQALARLEAEERQAAAATLSATGNVCHFLLTHYEALRRRRLACEGSFHLPLKRKQLADALGLTTIHLRRVLAGLEAAGVLTFQSGRVNLLDAERAGKLAGNPQFVRSARPLL